MEKIQIIDYRQNNIVSVEKISKTKAEWKQLLTPQQYKVTTEKGTEAPFTCTFDEIKEPGIFSCLRCGTDLFASKVKFHSGTGWPSYYQPVSDLNVREETDTASGCSERRCSARGATHISAMFSLMGRRQHISVIVSMRQQLNSAKNSISRGS